MTRDDAIAYLNSDDSPLATHMETIRGDEFEVYTHAPNSMRDFFTFSNTHYPDNEFLIYLEERYTFNQVHRQAVAVSQFLLDLGVKPGDRIAISMRNYPEYCPIVEAIISVGAIVVTLNSWWKGEELEYGIEDSGSRFAFVDQERWNLLEPYRDMLDLGVAIARPAGDLPEGILDLTPIINMDCGESLPDIPIDTDSDTIIMYTSGSTGHPKGVVMTQRSVVSALLNFSFSGLLGPLMQDVDMDVFNEVAKWVQLGKAGMDDPLASRMPASSMLVNVPFFHVSGLHTMQFLSYRSGRKLVLMYKWNAEMALELAEKEGLTDIQGVPTMIGEILNSPQLKAHDTSTVLRIGGGGSARPPEHVKLLLEHFPETIPSTGYGMTETNAIGTTIAGEDYVGRPNAVGRATPKLISIEIRDEEGNVLGPNEEGEICMKSSGNMRCYWNKPEATDEVLIDGWMLSGDLGHLDEEGFVFITGRAKDIIIRGGENIACAEIEYSLYENSKVNEASVHGAPDDRLGEIVCATVFLKKGEEASEEEIKAHVKSQLAVYKVPAHIFFVDEPLPRIASGKFDKRALQQRAIDWLEAAK
jgi:long-chain acyl-CoA synthetase